MASTLYHALVQSKYQFSTEQTKLYRNRDIIRMLCGLWIAECEDTARVNI